MKLFWITLVFFLATIAQISFSHLFFFWRGNGPNLVLVLILLLAIRKGFKEIWWLAAALGLLLDFFSGFAFGAIAFSLVWSAFIVDWFNRKVFSEVKIETVASLILSGSLLYYFFLIGANALLSFMEKGKETDYLCYLKDCVYSSFPSFLGGLGINLLLAGLVFYGFKKVRLFE